MEVLKLIKSIKNRNDKNNVYSFSTEEIRFGTKNTMKYLKEKNLYRLEVSFEDYTKHGIIYNLTDKFRTETLDLIERDFDLTDNFSVLDRYVGEDEYKHISFIFLIKENK